MIADQFIEGVVKSVRKGDFRMPLDRVVLRLKASDPIPLDIPVEIQQKPGGLRCVMRTTPATIVPKALSKLMGKTRDDPVSITPEDYLQIEALTPQGLALVLDGVSPLTSNQQSFLSVAATTHNHS